jgi:intracellular multiplication protein IcmK
VNKKSVIFLSILLGAIDGQADTARPAPGTSPPPSLSGETEQQIIERAFRAATLEKLPMSPGQINEFQKKTDDVMEAIHPAPPPKMVSRSVKLILQPGSPAIKINMAPGYVSSLLVIDSTGAPWPISTVTVGNSKWFNVVKPETSEGNLITLSPLTNHASSNLTITLQGKDIPLIVQLLVDGHTDSSIALEADALVSFQVEGHGPKANPPVLGDTPRSPASTELISFIDGVPPAGSVEISLIPSVPGVQAWEYAGQIYLRTRYPALSPAWSQIARGSGDLRVYVMPKVASLLVSVNGQAQSLMLSN